MKRLLIWFVELVIQAVLISVAMVLIVKVDSSASVRDICVLSVSSLFMFVISGYAITTGIERVFWRHHGFYSFSLVASALYVAHFELLNFLLPNGLGAPDARMKLIFAGTSFAFFTTVLGSLILRLWISNEQHA